MSKISEYLNEHLLGEVSVSDNIKKSFSEDESILLLPPDMVVLPRVTNDIRKIARFAWQLAEKERPVSLTPRGDGYGVSGGAISRGIIIDVSTYLNKILYISPKGKNRLVHVQAGVSMDTLNTTLATQGLTIHAGPNDQSTVGGVIAENGQSPYEGRYGYLTEYLERLEVVLASGDIIETGRLTRRETSQKKALATLEGEIYRGLDQIIDENEELIAGLPAVAMAGYNGIKDVRKKDGSMDLTPLFVASQGTLGIITEAVFNTLPLTVSDQMAVVSFANKDIAFDALDQLQQLEPARLEYLDGELFREAKTHGKNYGLFDEATVQSVIFIAFDDSSERTKRRKMKKLLKTVEKISPDASTFTSEDHTLETLLAVPDVWTILTLPLSKTKTSPDILSGALIPQEGRVQTISEIRELGQKLAIDLPVSIDWLSGRTKVLTSLNLTVVGDRQKSLKLIKDYTNLVLMRGGIVRPEGRLGAFAYYDQLDQPTIDLYTQIKAVFDPLNVLNNDAKIPMDVRKVAANINPKFTGNPFR